MLETTKDRNERLRDKPLFSEAADFTITSVHRLELPCTLNLSIRGRKLLQDIGFFIDQMGFEMNTTPSTNGLNDMGLNRPH